MPGAILELVARGEQDIHLIGNPSITFFKTIYKKHTNFSMETIEQNFNENPKFDAISSATIEKKGDLLNKIFIQIDLPSLTAGTNISWINGIGHHIIEYAELRLGGEVIDKVYGELLDIWTELTTTNSHQGGYYKMVGKFGSYNKSVQTGALKLFVPLPFWFCRDVSRSLPLISMQYTDVKVTIKFRPFNKLYNLRSLTAAEIATIGNLSGTTITNAKVLCDYIYLDEYERKKFAGAQEITTLIEQFQICDNNEVTASLTNLNIPLNFNHPTKEIMWIYRSNTNIDTHNDRGNYSSNASDAKPFVTVELKMNGNSRFKSLPGDYFRLVQPYKHHTNGHENYIYSYSFALEPEKLQPSGSCNFSKIDNTTLNLTLSTSILAGFVTVYAFNYNIVDINDLIFASILLGNNCR